MQREGVPCHADQGCGSSEHRRWDDCPKGPRISGIPMKYLGMKNANGVLACLTCGSFDHQSIDCDQLGSHGLGGPKYTGKISPVAKPQLSAKVSKGKQSKSRNMTSRWGSDSEESSDDGDEKASESDDELEPPKKQATALNAGPKISSLLR